MHSKPAEYKKEKKSKRKKRIERRVPSIPVLQFADDNGELCFLLDSQRSF
jgi:hypothetical protein